MKEASSPTRTPRQQRWNRSCHSHYCLWWHGWASLSSFEGASTVCDRPTNASQLLSAFDFQHAAGGLENSIRRDWPMPSQISAWTCWAQPPWLGDAPIQNLWSDQWREAERAPAGEVSVCNMSCSCPGMARFADSFQSQVAPCRGRCGFFTFFELCGSCWSWDTRRKWFNSRGSSMGLYLPRRAPWQGSLWREVPTPAQLRLHKRADRNHHWRAQVLLDGNSGHNPWLFRG